MPIQKNVVEHYQLHHSVNETAKEFCISAQTLITNGIYLYERSREVARLRLAGMTVPQIAEYLNLDEKVVKSHLPYTKGSYATGTKTINADRIAKSRDKKKQQEGTDNAKN